MMDVYCATCDRYDHLMPGFAYLFNRYWGADQQVKVLHFRPLPALPSNFISCCMAPVETLTWTQHMHRYFRKTTAPYFTLLLDDYWLAQPVRHDMVKALEQEVAEQRAVKASLIVCPGHPDAVPWRPGYQAVKREAQYRNSLQAHIWSRAFFLASVRGKQQNIWNYEIGGNHTDETIIIPEGIVYPVGYQNIYNKGVVQPGSLTPFEPAVLDDMRGLGYLDFVTR